jgi:hypothetical protein
MRNVKNIMKDMKRNQREQKIPLLPKLVHFKIDFDFYFFMVNKNVFNGKRTNLKQKQIGFVSFLCSLSSYFWAIHK